MKTPSKLSSSAMLAIANGSGYRFIRQAEILYCEAQGNYTNLVTSVESFTTNRSLKQIVESLDKRHFVRVHHGIVINLRHAVQFSDDGDSCLVISNGDKVPVSRRKRKDLLKHFTQL